MAVVARRGRSSGFPSGDRFVVHRGSRISPTQTTVCDSTTAAVRTTNFFFFLSIIRPRYISRALRVADRSDTAAGRGKSSVLRPDYGFRNAIESVILMGKKFSYTCILYTGIRCKRRVCVWYYYKSLYNDSNIRLFFWVSLERRTKLTGE